MRQSTIVFAVVIILLAASAVICGKNNKNGNDLSEKPKAEPTVIATGSGLKYIDLKVGKGTTADNGMEVKVHYTLWLDSNGEKGRQIDSSREPEPKPFPFTVGMKGLISGWNEGMLGMKPGGLRKLYIPSALGYGVAGRPSIIPANSDLIFEIELLEIL